LEAKRKQPTARAFTGVKNPEVGGAGGGALRIVIGWTDRAVEGKDS